MLDNTSRNRRPHARRVEPNTAPLSRMLDSTVAVLIVVHSRTSPLPKSRCLYTKQKSKKRKVWSDGAVSCCPKRQRVALHRWSEVLGVTDKLLGEIYLSVPEYDAFVTQGEPELEMEV